MNALIVFCFIVLIGLVIIAYLFAYKKIFNIVKSEIHGTEGIDNKPGRGESIRGFFSRVRYVFLLIMQEKKIITFAIFQWTAIAVGYFLWVQMLDWIPAEVWQSTEESDAGSIADFVFLAWSFLCIGVVAFPLSIFSACMGAVYFLRRQGKPSTIASCLQIVLPKAWSLWIFQWIDGWITVKQILKRLPKKNDKTTPAQKALSESLYYAWKLGVIGIIPSLTTGRGLVESCKLSASLVRRKFAEVTVLRMGYSAICWVIGIAAYIGVIVFFCVFDDLVPSGKEMNGHVYTFYFWAGVPTLIAVGVIQLFIRPIYLISSCDIFSDYLGEKQEKVMMPMSKSKGISACVAFVVLVLILAIIFLYRYDLGIMDMLATPYGQKYVPK